MNQPITATTLLFPDVPAWGRVEWVSSVTGKHCHHPWVLLADATKAATESNVMFPDVDHWVQVMPMGATVEGHAALD